MSKTEAYLVLAAILELGGMLKILFLYYNSLKTELLDWNNGNYLFFKLLISAL